MKRISFGLVLFFFSRTLRDIRANDHTQKKKYIFMYFNIGMNTISDSEKKQQQQKSSNTQPKCGKCMCIVLLEGVSHT